MTSHRQGSGVGRRAGALYSKIVVPLDGSKLAEQILPYARLLAGAYEIPVELLRVHEPGSKTPYWPPLPNGDYLKHISARYLSASLSVDLTEEMGEPAELIVEWAKRNPACLIAIATHGLSGMRRWLLGSVASKVVHGATNALLLIRPAEGLDPGAEVEFKTVFVPLDGSGLAEKILPHVAALVKRLDLEVQIVRAFKLPAEFYMVGDGLYMQSLGTQREMIEKEASTYLEGVNEKLRTVGVKRVVATAIDGDAAELIIDLAQKTPRSLIAMSTHGRSGIGRWMLGSVAERVIQHSKNPVLLLRPA
jgi:nucleotide-binding universal stress UspA family protein